MNKSELVRQHLLRYGSITSWQAINLYGETRLASVICNLRDKGYDIRTIMCDMVDKYGNEGQYAKYVYKGALE